MYSGTKILALLGMLLVSPVWAQVRAADLYPSPIAADETVSYRDALSRYLSLEMVRATFDVLPKEDIEPQLAVKAARWAAAPPSPAELADINEQLLAEASYYITSLSYLVQVGGAVFPGDRAESVYANDTIARLDGLRRELMAAIEDGADVLPILTEVEQIRALTEGHTGVPDDFGVFAEHEQILDRAIAAREKAGVTPA